MLSLNKMVFCFNITILAADLTIWTLGCEMSDHKSSLYHLPTIIGTLYFHKLTTIGVCKMISNVIHFTLPITPSMPVSTVYMGASNFSVNRVIWISSGATFCTTDWANIWFCCLPVVETRFTHSLSLTTLAGHVCISTGVLADIAYATIVQRLHKNVLISTITRGSSHSHYYCCS